MFPESLLERARQGDSSARNTLLGNLRPFVRAVIRRQGCRDADASDFANETLLRVHRFFGDFSGNSTGEFKAWCRMIAVNLWRDYCRRKRLPVGPLDDEMPDSAVGVPEADLLGEEESAPLAAALEQLRPNRRQVLELRFLDGLTCAEVARRLGRTEGWVRITSLRACEDMRRIYRGQP